MVGLNASNTNTNISRRRRSSNQRLSMSFSGIEQEGTRGSNQNNISNNNGNARTNTASSPSYHAHQYRRARRISVGTRGKPRTQRQQQLSPLITSNSVNSGLSSYTEMTYYSDTEIISSDDDDVSISDCSSSFHFSDNVVLNGLDNNCNNCYNNTKGKYEEANRASFPLLTNHSQRTQQSFFSLKDLVSMGTVSSLSDNETPDDDSDGGDTKDTNTDGEEEEKQYFNNDDTERRIEITFASSNISMDQRPQEQRQLRIITGRRFINEDTILSDGEEDLCELTEEVMGNNDEEELTIKESETEMEERFDDDLEEEEEYRVLLNDVDDETGTRKRDVRGSKHRNDEYSIESVDDETVEEEEIIEIEEVILDDNEQSEEEIEEVIINNNEHGEEVFICHNGEAGKEAIEEVALEQYEL
ncbi:unnamed protein product [Pseudo-nitzschia multistriata]|uniref:Uncharacterized protein n=1 Tax=Pseudo-nitzschia multistriata TaxID=183589 RepID=A0A448ZDU9_9STRA|nr:unnamed protein product [Pseudo-nitzschia multistriata]